MNISHQRQGPAIVVCLEGELGHHEARSVMQYLEHVYDLYAMEPVILDLRRLTFMDSSGIAVALMAARRAKENGGKLEIRHAPPQAMRVFRAAGIDRMVTFGEQEETSHG